jgi:hypothetical protein
MTIKNSLLDIKFDFILATITKNFTRQLIFSGLTNVLYTLKKKLTHFATKSSEIIISSIRAGSTLQKRSLLYKNEKNIFFVFLFSLMMLNFFTQGFYNIQVTPNKLCLARMKK